MFPLRIKQRDVPRLHLFELVQLWLLQTLPPEDVPLEKVRRRLRDLVLHMRTGRHGKDVIQLLECALLGLGQPKENHPEGEKVETGVEAKGALGFEGTQDAEECERQHAGPEVVRCDGP